MHARLESAALLLRLATRTQTDRFIIVLAHEIDERAIEMVAVENWGVLNCPPWIFCQNLSFYSLSFTFTALFLVLYLLHPGSNTEEKMTQIGGTACAQVKKKKKHQKVVVRGRRRDGWQLGNLLATPASCQRSIGTNTFFPLLPQVLFFFCFPSPARRL